MTSASTAALAAFSVGWVLSVAGTPAAAQGNAKRDGTATNVAAPKPAPAQNDYAQRFAKVCAVCHGANGRSDAPGVPVLAGQPSVYAITQLFLFREGRRSNEAMTAIAKGMSDDDMRGFSDYIGTLAPVAAPALATPPDPALMAKGRTLAAQHQCLSCHGPDLAGGQQVPRIAGQREEYLKAALHEFKSGKRVGYTQAMPSVVSQIPVEDLDTLAYFAARFTGATTSGK